MLKILSVDPSGTGTTGICLIWGSTKLFFEFFSRIWQEHYQYVSNLIQKEKPNIVLIETAYYETKSRNKDIMDLEKLVGALECLKFHTKSQIVMRQNKLTKDFGEKLKNEEETIPNLFHFSGKWIYYEEQRQKLQEWIKSMGGKVQEKPKDKPKPKESKNSPNTKLMPLSSGIFTQNLVHILENSQEYQEIAVIASRGEGKTWTTVHWILPLVHKDKEKFLWLRRYPEDARYSLLNYFQERVNEYCDWNNISVNEQKRLWEVIVRGTFYEKNNSIIFAELEHYNKARGAFSKNPFLIAFDEAIPRMLDWKTGYLTSEPDKFKDFWKSMWRNKELPKPTILHLSNAYDRTYHRLADWDEEIDEIADQELWKKGDFEDWYWEREKEVFCEDTQKTVKKRLVFFRKKGDQEGWPAFFIKKGDFNVQKVEQKDLIPLEVYNNKYLLARSKKKTYTLHLDYLENFPK